MKSNISLLPPSPAHIAQAVKDCVANNQILTPKFPSDTWEGVVTIRQVHLCLKEGNVINTPVHDEYGNPRFQMSRLCAGQEIVIECVIIEKDNNKYVRVISVENTRTD